MERLLSPRLFFRGFHIGLMAGEPVQELDPELCFERRGINAGAHPAKDVEPVRVRSSATLGFAGQQGSVASGIQKSGVPPPSFAPKKPGGATPMTVNA
jgi:hypothetical protein